MKTRKPLLETLGSRQLMAVDVLESEPNNSEATANRFSLPPSEIAILKGSISSSNDRDYFRFTASASGPVQITSKPNNAIKFEVTSSTGQQVFEAEPKDGRFAGQWNAEANQSYWIKVRSADKQTSDYAISLNAGSNSSNTGSPGTGGGNSTPTPNSTGPELEPNDRVESSTVVALTDSIHLTGSASKKDRDFFSVIPASSGQVAINVLSRNVKVSVETQAGAKLFESEPNDGITSGSFAGSKDQQLVIRVRGLDSSSSLYDVALSMGTQSQSNLGANTSANAVTPEAWFDASDDGVVSPLDALVIINHLNTRGSHSAIDDAIASFDVNDDDFVTAIDTLLVINRLNKGRRADDTGPDDSRTRPTPTGEGEGTDDVLNRKRRSSRHS